MADSIRIAMLGATSQIAKDLIISFSQHTDYHCILFSRSPEKVAIWLQSTDRECLYQSKSYLDFSSGDYDAIINFVGVGDPARAKVMGASIFDITYQYDQLALDYVKLHLKCKYIFLSSGAVYGDVFDSPVDSESVSKFSINHLNSSNWYGLAKLYAEARHRALPKLPIIDVRVFNYFSHTQDISTRFFIADVLRAIRAGEVLRTSSEYIVRDFLHPSDFYQLVNRILTAPSVNMAVDCFTAAPIDKPKLLATMRDEFDLRYEIMEENYSINATGSKPFYYSLNKSAEKFGYRPIYTSLEGVLKESSKILGVD